jgi:hypothetical protein
LLRRFGEKADSVSDHVARTSPDASTRKPLSSVEGDAPDGHVPTRFPRIEEEESRALRAWRTSIPPDAAGGEEYPSAFLGRPVIPMKMASSKNLRTLVIPAGIAPPENVRTRHPRRGDRGKRPSSLWPSRLVKTEAMARQTAELT